MDPVTNVTAGAGTAAPDDAMDVERKRAADRPNRRSEREAELAEAQETIRQIEQAAAAKAAQIEELEEAIGRVNGSAYLLFAWTPDGYALHHGTGELPGIGRRLKVNGHEYAVAKVARSPLPGDGRPCAYLQPL